ncbi:transposase [Streptomyces sp. NPDC051041]|uniref:transposase n=1 Tax=Streptomyces sp. NPDC051041 TaxID=3365640 RepID=UPI00379E5D4A
MARIAGRVGRVEPGASARARPLGLLSNAERKNCRQPAEQAGPTWPGPMRRLLRYARWDADAVRDDLRAYAVEHLGTDGAVLIVDETGFMRKEYASAGVQRQYTGTAGRIGNAQFGVFLACTTSRGRALVDRRFHLPEHSWVTVTKPTGRTLGFVPPLKPRGTGYVMVVACSRRMRINAGPHACLRGHRRRTPARHRLAAAQRGQRREGPAPLRLGLDSHRHRRTPPPPDPPQPHHRRTRLLPVLITHHGHPCGAGPRRRRPLERRRVPPGSEGPGRTRPLPSQALDLVAPAHHPRRARPGLPGRRRRRRGTEAAHRSAPPSPQQ